MPADVQLGQFPNEFLGVEAVEPDAVAGDTQGVTIMHYGGAAQRATQEPAEEIHSPSFFGSEVMWNSFSGIQSNRASSAGYRGSGEETVSSLNLMSPRMIVMWP